MKGQIVKILSNLYFVDCENEIIPCHSRGNFRNKKIIPLVGDFCIIDKEQKYIMEILPRKSSLIRPSVANIDQALIVTSLKTPDFSSNLLDKLITVLEINNIKPIICITKEDIISDIEKENIRKIMSYYEKIGYIVLYNYEIEKIKKIFKGKTTVFTGQTGAGKSSLFNKLDEKLKFEVGEVSLALGRGKHTTRHVEIIIKDNIKVLDTPGFSALSFLKFTKEDVRDAFLEFKNYPCPFKDCMHIKELECNVIKNVENKNILESRYNNYKNFIEEFRR